LICFLGPNGLTFFEATLKTCSAVRNTRKMVFDKMVGELMDPLEAFLNTQN